MPKKRSNPDKSDYPYPNLKSRWVLYTRIIACTLGGLGVIVWLCSYIKDKPVYWQVLMGSVVTWLILMQMLFQTHVSQKQWKAMKKGLKHTHTLIEQNKKIIIAAQRQADAAENALTQTKEFFTISERPSIGMEEVWLHEIERGWAATVIVRNTGRGPAKNVNIRVIYNIYPGDAIFNICPEPQDVEIDVAPGNPVVAINGALKSAVYLTTEQVAEMKAGTIRFFLWTRCSYEGFNGGKYFLEGYAYYSPIVGAFEVCNIHNDAN